MNSNPGTPEVNRASGAAIGLIIASVIFLALAVAAKLFIHAPAIDADRAAARYKALFEIQTNETATLDNAGWIDRSRGVVRLPIETAMQEAAQAWQNPAAARADLLARQEKASAPAPVAPAQPSAFE
jgi:hypothetical protein